MGEVIDVLKAQLVRGAGDGPAPPGWGLALDAREDQAVIVVAVSGGSPAARVGLQPGDVITEVDGAPVTGAAPDQVTALIDQHTTQLSLTIERKAGPGRAQYLPMAAAPPPQAKAYQTYDMTGRPAPSYDYATAVARPFEQRPPGQRNPPPGTSVGPASPPLRPPPRWTDDVPGVFLAQGDETDLYMPNKHSRSFQALSCLMANREPSSGVAGLPPPRSATLERRKQSQGGAGGAGGSGRVKVFMPQQYNNPMSLYSAPNVVETFAQQAQGLMQELDHTENT